MQHMLSLVICIDPRNYTNEMTAYRFITLNNSLQKTLFSSAELSVELLQNVVNYISDTQKLVKFFFKRLLTNKSNIRHKFPNLIAITIFSPLLIKRCRQFHFQIFKVTYDNLMQIFVTNFLIFAQRTCHLANTRDFIVLCFKNVSNQDWVCAVLLSSE